MVSGRQTQQDMNTVMEQIVDGHLNLFEGIVRAKVEPVHIQTEASHTPVQQKRSPVALHYKEKLKEHLDKLKAADVVSGPLGSEWAT